MSAREAERQFEISRDSTRKVLGFLVPLRHRCRAYMKRPKLDGFTEVIDARFTKDPRKLPAFLGPARRPGYWPDQQA